MGVVLERIVGLQAVERANAVKSKGDDMNSNKCCPKCGGKSGYDFNAVEKQGWSGQWEEPKNDFIEGKEEFIQSLQFTVGKTVTCKDCGKRISRN